jgi:hypothetical protein
MQWDFSTSYEIWQYLTDSSPNEGVPFMVLWKIQEYTPDDIDWRVYRTGCFDRKGSIVVGVRHEIQTDYNS